MNTLQEFQNYAEGRLGNESIISVGIALEDYDLRYRIKAIIDGRAKIGEGRSMAEAMIDLVDVEVVEVREEADLLTLAEV